MSANIYKKLFEHPGPLSAFSGKIVMAYALHIITKEEYVELEKIRKMRNLFAHSSDLLNFESESIGAVLASMKRPPTAKATKPVQVFLESIVALDSKFEEYLAQPRESPSSHAGP